MIVEDLLSLVFQRDSWSRSGSLPHLPPRHLRVSTSSPLSLHPSHIPRHSDRQSVVSVVHTDKVSSSDSNLSLPEMTTCADGNCRVCCLFSAMSELRGRADVSFRRFRGGGGGSYVSPLASRSTSLPDESMRSPPSSAQPESPSLLSPSNSSISTISESSSPPRPTSIITPDQKLEEEPSKTPRPLSSRSTGPEELGASAILSSPSSLSPLPSQAPMTSFFAVYDGHVGREAAHYARYFLHRYVLASPFFWTDLGAALSEVREREQRGRGATALSPRSVQLSELYMSVQYASPYLAVSAFSGSFLCPSAFCLSAPCLSVSFCLFLSLSVSLPSPLVPSEVVLATLYVSSFLHTRADMLALFLYCIDRLTSCRPSRIVIMTTLNCGKTHH